MKIKICGITRVEDALCCIENRVDLIGLNFYAPSPRSVDLSQAMMIQDRIKCIIGNTKVIGVFVNANISEIRTIFEHCQLDAVQLHGDETPDTIRELRNNGVPVYKAFRGISAATDLEGFITDTEEELPDLLIDAYHPGLYGGTGKVIEARDLTQIDEKLADLWPAKDRPRYLLAGGLKPSNVAEVIKLANPWGVDTASGVESSPGIKDPELIEQFCNAARNINA